MKTALSLNFEMIGIITLIWDRRTWICNWNLSRVVVTKLTIPKKKNKVHKEEAKAEEQETEEVEAPVPLVTHVNNILRSIFSNVELYISDQQIYSCNGLYAQKQYSSNNFKGAVSEHKGVLHCEGYDYEEFLEEIMEALLSEPFSTRRMKMRSRLDGFLLYGILGVDFLSTSEVLYPNIKIRLRLITARPNFYMISDNPIVSPAIVDCSLYTRRIALKDDCHKKRMDMLAYTLLWSSTIEVLLQRLSSFKPDKTSFFKKTFWTILQIVELHLQKIQTLHSLDLILKIHSGINKLISHKLEYSEEISQS